jgi:CheY-like chemotaxis protein/anti-sigma regulatory factor (Ser/Thr protein kinase)
MMSHEIRTPLNVIIGSASLLSEEPLLPQQREYAETIHSSGQSLLSVLNDVLDVSKIEAGRMTLEEVVFDLRGAVEDVMDLFITSAATRHLRLVLKFNARLDGIYNGDPGRLKQVLVNLVGNALKFTEAGSVEVCVEPAAESRRVQFSVTDTGIGIEPAAQAHLFGAFQQADSTTTRRFGGTGLGLAIARRLVELMGGSIACESAPGKGSRFSFSVPLPLVELPRMPELRGACAVFATPRAELEQCMALLRCTGYEPYLAVERYAVLEDPPALVIVDPLWPGFQDPAGARQFVDAMLAIESLRVVRLAQSGVDTPAWAEGLLPLSEPWLLRRFRAALCPSETVLSKLGSTNSYPGRRLLLVEDNPLNRRLALRMLQRLGCEVDEAADGLEAVSRTSERHYDLILMDLQMPGADGFEATRRIRRNELDRRKHRVPIVAFTAGVFSGERKQAFEAGMDDFLSKPVVKDQLIQTCSRWFESTSGPQ